MKVVAGAAPQLQFRVKWEGYPHLKNTWEPEGGRGGQIPLFLNLRDLLALARKLLGRRKTD